MAKRKIVWTPLATQQLKEIVLFWNRNNESNTYSKRILKATNTTAKTIAAFPHIGKQTDVTGIRVAIVLNNFSLFYRLIAKRVEVLLFWDNRQDPDELRKLIS